MAQANEKKVVQIVRTEVGFNHIEVGYAEDLNNSSIFQVPRITIIESWRRPSRARMDAQMVSEIRDQIAIWKGRYPNAKIMHFFQLIKGTTRNAPQLKALQDAQDGADVRCFYEKSRTQNEDALRTQLEAHKKAYPKGKQFVVLEIEGTNINAKVATALDVGFKSFIIAGGEYYNPTLWQGLTAMIRQAEGYSIGLPYQRMNNHSKESRIKFMVQVGVDYVVHGSLGFGEGQVLFLDEEDGFYKSIRQITDAEVIQAVNATHSKLHYKLSRFLAIGDGNSFAVAHPQPIVEE